MKSLNLQVFEVLDKMYPKEKYSLEQDGIYYYPTTDKPHLHYVGDFDYCDLNLSFWLADKVCLFDNYVLEKRRGNWFISDYVQSKYPYALVISEAKSIPEVICKAVIKTHRKTK